MFTFYKKQGALEKAPYLSWKHLWFTLKNQFFPRRAARAALGDVREELIMSSLVGELTGNKPTYLWFRRTRGHPVTGSIKIKGKQDEKTFYREKNFLRQLPPSPTLSLRMMGGSRWNSCFFLLDMTKEEFPNCDVQFFFLINIFFHAQQSFPPFSLFFINF